MDILSNLKCRCLSNKLFGIVNIIQLFFLHTSLNNTCLAFNEFLSRSIFSLHICVGLRNRLNYQ